MTAKAVIAFAIPVISRDQAIERKVEATPSKMTLDEKIGRTTEFAIVMIALRGSRGDDTGRPGKDKIATSVEH